jgi:hypothetical protein
MNMHPVKSSNISALGYDAEKKELHVQFTNGTSYSYAGVPEHEYKSLASADSVGKRFHTHVKEKFKHERVGGHGGKA